MYFARIQRTLFGKFIAPLLFLTVVLFGSLAGPFAQTAHAQTATQDPSDFSGYMPLCSIGLLPLSSGSFVGCISLIINFIFYQIPSYFMEIMGKILDFFLGFSIDSNSYSNGIGATVKNGWIITRDISNIFFILLLIYAAIATIFNVSSVNWKAIVPNLIINALLINFSLFITMAMVDISNIAAHVFYNQIAVEDTNHVRQIGTGGYTPLSESIVSAYEPQRIMVNILQQGSTNSVSEFHIALRKTWETLKDPAVSGNIKQNQWEDLYDNYIKPTGINTFFNSVTMFDVQTASEADLVKIEQRYATAVQGSSKQDFIDAQRATTSYAGKFIAVSILVGTIAFFTGLMFFKVAFVFIGRVIGILIAMIFSPFAFMSRKMPFLGSIERLGWTNWLSSMTNYMVVAPLFVFFLYVIHRFIVSDFYTAIVPKMGAGLLDTIISVCLPMFVIFGLINAAKKITLKYGGEFSEMIGNFAKQATGYVGGAALGVATGGIALAGTRFGSRIGKAVGKTGLGRKIAANADSNWFARQANRGLNWSQNSSWDLKKTALGGVLQNNALYKKMGISMKDTVSDKIGLGSKRFEGGYKGQQKRRQDQIKKNIEKRVNYDYLDDEQAKAMWAKRQQKKAEGKAKDAYFAATNTGYKDRAKKIEDDEVLLKQKEKEIKTLQGEIEKNLKTPAEKEAAEKTIFQNQKDISTLLEEIKNNKNRQQTFVSTMDLTKGEYKDSAEFKQKLKAAQEKQQSDDKKTYGKVESSKDLTAAIRRDYVEDLRNNSFWMKNGKQEKGLSAVGGVYGSAAAGLAGLGTFGTGIAGGIMAERIKFEQEALDAATKSYIKDYGKKKGKTSKVDQYKAQIDEINNKVKDVVNEALKNTGKTFDDIKDDIDEHKGHVKNEALKAESEYEVKNADFEKKKEEYKKTGSKSAEDALKQATKDRKEVEDKMNGLKNLWKNKEDLEEKISKEEDKEKGDGKKDDKKEEGKK